MRVSLLLPGVIILLLGAYLFYSPPALDALTSQVGLLSTQTTLDGNYALRLNESIPVSFPVVLSENDNLSASVQANPGVDLLIMNSGNYSSFSATNGSHFQVFPQSKLNVSSYSFSFSGKDSLETYYLVFESPSTRGGETDILLHVVVIHTTDAPEAQYIPLLILALGLVLLIFGSITNRKSPRAPRFSPQDTKSSKCAFCGAEMSQSSAFCPVCKKSQS